MAAPAPRTPPTPEPAATPPAPPQAPAPLTPRAHIPALRVSHASFHVGQRPPMPRGSTPEGRRHHLLRIMTVTLAVIVFFSLLVTLFVTPNLLAHDLYISLLTVSLVFLLAAYALNRIGAIKAAVWFVGIPVVAIPWWAILGDSSILRTDPFPIAYLALSIFLVSLLASPFWTFLVGALQTGGLVVVMLLLRTTRVYNWPSILIFIASAGVVVGTVSLLNRADLRQASALLVQLQENEAKIRDLAFRDPLTGVWNRRCMEEALPRALSYAKATGRSLAFVMADVDRFKTVNDRFGHPAGDQILAAVAKALTGSLRESDDVFRYGGDEFLIVLPDATRASATLCIDRINTAVYAIPLPTAMAGEPPIHLTCGVAVCPDGDCDAADLLALADKELYRIKHGG